MGGGGGVYGGDRGKERVCVKVKGGMRGRLNVNDRERAPRDYIVIILMYLGIGFTCK